MKIFMFGAVVVFGIIIGVALGVWYGQQKNVPEPTPDGVMCTMDAMECPNGVVVGRTGPNCEFVCPTGETSELPEVPADYLARKP